MPGIRTLRLRPGSREEQELDAALRELLLPLGGGARPSSGAPERRARGGRPADALRRGRVHLQGRDRGRPREDRRVRLPGVGGVSRPLPPTGGRPRRRRRGARRRRRGRGRRLAFFFFFVFLLSSSSALSLWALGADAEALALAGVPAALIRTPREASTTGMVAEMARGGGEGRGRRRPRPRRNFRLCRRADSGSSPGRRRGPRRAPRRPPVPERAAGARGRRARARGRLLDRAARGRAAGRGTESRGGERAPPGSPPPPPPPPPRPPSPPPRRPSSPCSPPGRSTPSSSPPRPRRRAWRWPPAGWRRCSR